jgi:hypothetical protein
MILLPIALLSKAQVTIGADREPHPGAVLELESNATRGLLMPHISFGAANTWQLGGNSIEGMVVYNESNNLKGKGFYVWTGSQWQIAQQTACSGAPVVGTISVSQTPIPVNVVFQAWVDPSSSATQYVWTITGTATVVGYSNTNIISLAGTKAGNAEISVKAINACGSTISSQSKSITIN